MQYSNKDLIQKVKEQDYAAIARLITLIENKSEQAQEILKKLKTNNNKTRIIGVTGPPGAGKSTLVDQLALKLKIQKKTIAILAVDPSSTFTQGAVLGDRIRMSSASNAGIFIRSIATRGALGGLAEAIPEVLTAMQAANFDYVIIETVGVGQAEIDIVQVADTTLVTLMPGLGDMVQAFKAGVLEIADIFVINKADHANVDQLEKELITLVSLNQQNWEVPIIKTIATKSQGIEELIDKIEEHQNS